MRRRPFVGLVKGGLVLTERRFRLRLVDIVYISCRTVLPAVRLLSGEATTSTLVGGVFATRHSLVSDIACSPKIHGPRNSSSDGCGRGGEM